MIENQKDFLAGERGALPLNPLNELCFARTSRQHAGLSDQHGRAPLFSADISEGGARAFCSLWLACCQPAFGGVVVSWQNPGSHQL